MRETKKPGLWERAMQLVFWIGLIAAGVGPPLLIYKDQSETGWALLLSALIVLLATRFDAIEELSFGPLRARLSREVEEATETLKRVRELAHLTAASTLSLVKMSGRMGGYTDAEEDEIKRSMIALLKQLNLTDAEVEEALSRWHQVVEYDYVHFLLGGNIVPDGFTDQERREWSQLRDGGIQNNPSPDVVEDYLARTSTLDEERKGLVEDYRHYVTHREHRRPRVWAAREMVQRLRKPPSD